MNDTAERRQWHEWKTSVFGSGQMIWRDGLDVGRVTELTGPQREQAERMLALGLRVEDSHAADALVAMKATHMLPLIREVMARARSRIVRMNLALAVHTLEPSEDLIEHVVAQLRATGDHFGHRLDAAIALRRFEPPRAAEEALWAIEHDPDYLVRYHALDSVGIVLGLGARLTDDPELFSLIRTSTEDARHERAEDRWARAAQRVRERAAGVSGSSASSED